MEIDLSDLFSDVNKVNEYLKANSNIGEDLDLNDVFGRLEAAAKSGWQTRDRIREVVQEQIIHDLGLIQKEEKVSKVSPAPKSDLLETAVKPSKKSVTKSDLLETTVKPSITKESSTKSDLLETAVKPSVSKQSVTKNKRKAVELTLSGNLKLSMEAKKLKICKFASASLFDDAQNTMSTNENKTAPEVKNDERMAISSNQKDENITGSQKPNVAEVMCNGKLKPTLKHTLDKDAIKNVNPADGMGEAFLVVSDNSDDEDDLAVVGTVGPINSTLSSSASSSNASVAPTNLKSSSPTNPESVEYHLPNTAIFRTICPRKRKRNLNKVPRPSTGGSSLTLDAHHISGISSSPGPSKAFPIFNIVTRSKSTENPHNLSSRDSSSIPSSVEKEVSGPAHVAKQLEDMFPHFKPEHLHQTAKKYVTIENAVDELLNEVAAEASSKATKPVDPNSAHLESSSEETDTDLVDQVKAKKFAIASQLTTPQVSSDSDEEVEAIMNYEDVEAIIAKKKLIAQKLEDMSSDSDTDEDVEAIADKKKLIAHKLLKLEDMFPHFSPEYLLETLKKYDTIENAVDELLNEVAAEASSKMKDAEMKRVKEHVAKSLILLGEKDMFKKVTLTEKRDFNPEDPLESKFRLAQGHYLSVSGQLASSIESIDYVENRALMENFERKKREFRTEGKDTREYFLFHGTNNVNVDSILQENFRMDLAGKHGQAHGRGIYFSEKTIILNQYMNGEKKTLLLCRVLLGREFLGIDRDIPKGFDSKSVQPDQERRASINIIKGVDQILPCFVLNLGASSGPGQNVQNWPGQNMLAFRLPYAFAVPPLPQFPPVFLGGGTRLHPRNSNPKK